MCVGARRTRGQRVRHAVCRAQHGSWGDDMYSKRYLYVLSCIGAFAVLSGPLAAQQKQPALPQAGGEEEGEEPTPTSLTVGALQIASDANLVVESIGVAVALDKVTYTYKLKNKGQSELALAASLAMPELSVSSDGSEIYNLPAEKAENPINLVITSKGTPIAPKIDVRAFALGVDRIADIKAANLPLIPFGPDVEKALASAKPETLDKLANAGIISPRDPNEPKALVTPDWALDVVYSWMQHVAAGESVPVVVSFVPVKGETEFNKESLASLDDFKDDACLTPQALASIKTKLQGKNVALKLTTLVLANDAPTRWAENPRPAVDVVKPSPDAIVGFCGLDPKTSAQPHLTGTMGAIQEEQASDFRVLIFQPE
jgi:hypothetical protein